MEYEKLEKIGLTRNESIVYLTLVKIGTSKSGDLLKESGLNSGKIYEIFSSLLKKGLISESLINNIKHFTASPPIQLLKYVDSKKKCLKEQEKCINQMLPNLDKLRNFNFNFSKSVTYVGYKGIITATEEAFEQITPKDEIIAMGVTNKKESKYNNFWIDLNQKRVKKKIKTRLLFSDQGNLMGIYSKMPLTKIRLINGFTPSAVTVFGKSIVHIANYQEPFSCILIYDQNIASSFTNFFNELWKKGKKIK